MRELAASSHKIHHVTMLTTPPSHHSTVLTASRFGLCQPAGPTVSCEEGLLPYLGAVTKIIYNIKKEPLFTRDGGGIIDLMYK
jgi:hypothetical protein